MQSNKELTRPMARILLGLGLAVLLLATATPGVMAGAVEQLLKDVQSEDAETRVMAADQAEQAGPEALYELGKLVDHENEFVVKDVRHAMENIVHHSNRPGADAERAKAAQELSRLIRAENSDKVVNEAVFLLAFVGDDQQVSILAEQLDRSGVREEAARTLEEVTGTKATRALLDALDQVPNAFKPRILTAVGRRHDPSAVRWLAEYAKKAPASLQVDVLEAILDSGGVPPLDCAIAIETLLSERDGDRIPDLMLRAADQLRAEGKKDQALDIYSKILAGAASEHLICGALVGIGKLEDASTLGTIGEYLSSEYPSIRGVATKIVTDWPGGEIDRTLAERFASAKGAEQAALLQILVERNTEGLDQILEGAMDADNSPVRVMAFEVLGDKGSENLASRFLESAKDSDGAVAQASRRAYLRLADRIRAQGDGSKALSMYHQALNFSGDSEAIQLALQGIAGMANAESVAKVEPLLEDPSVAEPAARAYLALAEKIGEKQGKAKRIEMIHKIVHHPNSGSVRNVALRQLKDLGEATEVFTKRQGFINTWHIIGPFPNENGSAFHNEFFPEKGVDLSKGGEVDGTKLEWKKVTTDEIPARISLSAEFEKNQFVTAYAYAELHAEKEMPVQILFGTNDGCEFWVNGEKRFEVNEERGCEIDGDKVETTLKPGVNTLLLKVLQAGGGWEYCVRLADKDGNHIDLTQVDLLKE
jgi:hypothetical protein